MKQTFDVTGMSCAACSARVEKCVSKLEGVQEVQVNLLANRMTVAFDDRALDTAAICGAVKKAGYGAAPRSGGGGSGGNTTAAAFGSAAGMTADSTGDSAVSAAEQEVRSMKHRLIASLIFYLPLFYISMGHMLGLPQPGFLSGLENAVTYGMAQLVLTLILMYINRKYYESGFPAFLRRAPNMDSLIAVGSLAAVIYGIFAIIRIGHGLAVQDWELVERYHMDMYFESAGTILTLITVGKFLEARSKGKTTDAISRLVKLAPDTALTERDGAELEVPLSAVRVGDVLLVKPGSRVPVDGVILEGASALDESFLTGESIPVDKTVGDEVTGGSINQSGFFKMRAERVGSDTSLAKIIALVEDAGGSKAPIAKLADKIAGVFVPVVMLIALGAAIIWLIAGQTFAFALSTGIAVLVISCPCALGLATPAAIMAGTGRGAELGILYKNAEILEQSRSIDTVIMDKTGTLTTGQPGVTLVAAASSLTAMQSDFLTESADSDTTADTNTDAAADLLLALTGALERPSEHPVGQAIARTAEQLSIAIPPVSDFTALHGRGVQGTVAGHRMIAGNLRMLQECEIAPGVFAEVADLCAETGSTPLYIAMDGQTVGVIAVADTIRPESAAAVKTLEAMGVSVLLLTGDNRRTAEAVAARLGITQVRSEILPEDKEQEVRSQMQNGRCVAMVGDGINDAPALARADVGIAVGAGTDVAIASADVVLMRSNPLDAAAAIQLSRAVIRNIRMNLFWAFFYNIIGIPIAAGVLYPFFGFHLNPMIGAAAMSLSSFCVVTNALRLRFFRPDFRYADTGRISGTHTGASAEMRSGAVSGSTAPAQKKDAANPAESYKIEIIEITPAASPEAAAAKEEQTMKKTLHVEGMMCKNCVAHVEKALKALEGVSAAEANLDEKTATVTLDTDVADEVLVQAVTEEGYEASMA